jgi:hypothetical protein
MTGVRAAFTNFMQFIPSLLGAIVVLVIGWMIAKVVARLLERVLLSVRFESAVSSAGVSKYLQQAFGSDFTTTHALSLLAKWFIALIFVQAAANLLAMPQVTAIINSIILFIPNLFIALVIMVVSALAARVIGRLVETSVSRTGISRPKLFSLIARYAILGFATIAAVNQLGIATNLLNILFTGLVGSISLALGLAFGLGGQGVAQDLTRSWYEQGKGAGAQLKAVNPVGSTKNK